TAKKITDPIQTLMKRMKHIASGHLKNKPLPVVTEDEIGQLMIASNEMNASMRNMLMKISNVTHTLLSLGEKLTHSTVEVRNGSEQISQTMETLATGADKQANEAIQLSTM